MAYILRSANAAPQRTIPIADGAPNARNAGPLHIFLKAAIFSGPWILLEPFPTSAA